MNVELLRQVKEAILLKPESFDMGDWVENEELNDKVRTLNLDAGLSMDEALEQAIKEHNANKHAPMSCGTQACIGGWAAVLSGVPEWPHVPYKLLPPHLQPLFKDYSEESHISISRIAQRLLGLTSEQADYLFYMENWPQRFVIRRFGGENRREEARAAAERIEYFIETNGFDGREEEENASED